MDKDLINFPLVTIAIPIYNAEKYLKFAIQSVINQTYQNWELLLMEDGSTDKSTEIAMKYSLIDSRIKYISDGINKGLVYRLNQSVSIAQGSLYARMDADDIMSIDRIKRQVDCFKNNKQLDVCGCSSMLIDEHNNIIGSQNMANVSDMFMHPTVMGKTEWFIHNKYDEAAIRIEDRDLWLRTCRNSIFFNLPEALLFYRAFGTPSSSQNIESNRRLRGLYKKYKRYNRNVFWCIKNCFATYIKDLIFNIIDFTGANGCKIYLRNRNPVPEKLALSKNDLDSAILSN